MANKEELRRLVLKAKGGRSVTEFLEQIEIDNTQWYRIINGKFNPNMRALIKIALASYGVVTIKELFRAAGYEDIYYAIQEETCDLCTYRV